MIVATASASFLHDRALFARADGEDALCGGLITAVKSVMPNMPRLEIENVPPWNSVELQFAGPGALGQIAHLG